MRLINIETLHFEEFEGDIPKYAILSHRWGQDEVSHDDYVNGRRTEGAGYAKIEMFCRAVQQYNDWRGDSVHEDITQRRNIKFSGPIHYVWIDTACIDRKSSAELSEAINSVGFSCERPGLVMTCSRLYTRCSHGTETQTSVASTLRTYNRIMQTTTDQAISSCSGTVSGSRAVGPYRRCWLHTELSSMTMHGTWSPTSVRLLQVGC